ncbi:hypothetical protein NMG60_11023041 [Bertholletia excelsa]
MARSLHQHYTSATTFFSLLLLSFPLLVTANIFIYAGCSEEKYQPNSAFEANFNSLLSSVVRSASGATYGSFAVGNGTAVTPPDSAIYGLFQCRGDLKLPDCAKCVQSLVAQITHVCPYTYGASLQLDACFMRYEHGDFLGKLDTGLRSKKCSKSVSNDVEFFRRRDDVLADLQAATGFRVSSSGMVEGFAQCLGDLSPTDCSACLGAAVGQLKSLCGSADVYLGQCYARYWASSYYNDSSHSSNHDDTGKTVAIIVGVLAGVAVFIVLLSVCRKSLS